MEISNLNSSSVYRLIYLISVLSVATQFILLTTHNLAILLACLYPAFKNVRLRSRLLAYQEISIRLAYVVQGFLNG